jgi:hypothetical protein
MLTGAVLSVPVTTNPNTPPIFFRLRRVVERHPVSSHPDQEITMLQTIRNIFSSINIVLNSFNRGVNVVDVTLRQIEAEVIGHATVLEQTREERISAIYAD